MGHTLLSRRGIVSTVPLLLFDDIRYDIREYLGHPDNPVGTFRLHPLE